MPHVMSSSKKCTGCHMCELACSAQHEGAYRPSVARLFSECNPTTAAIKGHTCLQTGCAKCQEACPNDAIVTTEITVKVKGEFPGKEKIGDTVKGLSLIHISEPTRLGMISYAVFCLKKKKKKNKN